MGRRALVDSNILIDALNGVSQALTEISYYADTAVSAVAWIEVVSKPMAAAAWSKLSPATNWQLIVLSDCYPSFGGI